MTRRIFFQRTFVSRSFPRVAPVAKGVSYMSTFRNHILANLANLSMCLSLMYWYLQSMYLGTKGDLFFQTCIFLVLSIPLCGSHFSHYCMHQL